MSIGELKVKAFCEMGRAISKGTEKTYKKLVTPHVIKTYNANTPLQEAEKFKWYRYSVDNIMRFLQNIFTPKLKK